MISCLRKSCFNNYPMLNSLCNISIVIWKRTFSCKEFYKHLTIWEMFLKNTFIYIKFASTHQHYKLELMEGNDHNSSSCVVVVMQQIIRKIKTCTCLFLSRVYKRVNNSGTTQLRLSLSHNSHAKLGNSNEGSYFPKTEYEKGVVKAGSTFHTEGGRWGQSQQPFLPFIINNLINYIIYYIIKENLKR